VSRTAEVTTEGVYLSLITPSSTLTELHGLGDLLAGKILTRVGDISRFRSAVAFASYTATAPIEVSSGDVVRRASPRPETDSSTPACTSWPSPKSAMTPPVAPSTSTNARLGKATGKHCDA
jgi:Transposase IS116/IS110/IS902 family